MSRIHKAEEFVYQGVGDGLFEIERNGTIWRIAVRQINRWNGEITLRPCARHRAEADTGTYLQVHLMVDGKKMAAAAGRLVWRHFRGVIPDGLTINHKNGCKWDNRLSNLELATRAEQQFHATRVLGRRTGNFVPRKGVENGRAKLTEKQVAFIREAADSCTALAAEYGVSIATISSVRLKRTWTHL